MIWAADLGVLAAASVQVFQDHNDHGKGVALFLLAALAGLLAISGGVIFWVTRVRSRGGLWTAIFVLIWPGPYWLTAGCAGM